MGAGAPPAWLGTNHARPTGAWPTGLAELFEVMGNDERAYPIESMYAIYMVTFTINIPQMLAYIPYMDPMGMGINYPRLVSGLVHPSDLHGIFVGLIHFNH